jgi:glycosyltransferase involved in cell wall biosynthesis
VAHRCYRGSAAATTVLTGMLTVHRAIRTWQTQVDAFIVLSRFARDRFLAGGIPGDRMHVSGGVFDGVEPGAAPPGAEQPDAEGGTHFLFVGRLSEEKGIAVLLAAWERLEDSVELRIIGDGPLRGTVTAAASRDPRIRWLGSRPREDVIAAMRGAYALVFPSLCYENFPGVLAEAQMAGLPVLASRLGSGAEIVSDGAFGLLFDTGDADSLAVAVRSLRQDRAKRAELSERARQRYEQTLTPARCHTRLLGIYERALEHRHAGADAPTTAERLATHD